MCATVRLPLASATSDRDTRLLRVELHKARSLSSKRRAHATWPFCDRTYINIYAALPGLRFCKVSHDILVVNDVSSHRPSVLCHTCSQLGSRFWRRPARRVYSLEPAGRQRCQVSPAGNQAVIEQHADPRLRLFVCNLLWLALVLSRCSAAVSRRASAVEGGVASRWQHQQHQLHAGRKRHTLFRNAKFDVPSLCCAGRVQPL